MPVFQYRFGDGIEQAKAIIDAGIAGKPFMSARSKPCGAARCTDYYCRALARQMGHPNWVAVLMGHAIHPHDLSSPTSWAISNRVFGRVATRVNADRGRRLPFRPRC